MNQKGATGKHLPNKRIGAFYQLALENEDNTDLLFDENNVSAGIEYLNLSLDKGFPVVVGVNHTFFKDKKRIKKLMNLQQTIL